MSIRNAKKQYKYYQEEYQRMFWYIQQVELYIREGVALGEYETLGEGAEEFHPLLKEWNDKAGVCMDKCRYYEEKINAEGLC